MSQDMSDLIKRLEGAETFGETDTLDLDLARWLYENPSSCGALINYDPAAWIERNGGWLRSLDAAMALAERVLPGWKRSVFEHGDGWLARVQAPAEKLPDGRGWVSGAEGWGKHAQAALALCAAILRAKTGEA